MLEWIMYLPCDKPSFPPQMSRRFFAYGFDIGRNHSRDFTRSLPISCSFSLFPATRSTASINHHFCSSQILVPNDDDWFHIEGMLPFCQFVQYVTRKQLPCNLSENCHVCVLSVLEFNIFANYTVDSMNSIMEKKTHLDAFTITENDG